MAYSLTTAVRGYHIYKAFWIATLGEVPTCDREESNPHNPFPVLIINQRVGCAIFNFRGLDGNRVNHENL